MSDTKRTGAWRAVLVRPRNAEGYPRPGVFWITFYYEPGSTLPQCLRVKLQILIGGKVLIEEWIETGRKLKNGYMLDVYLKARGGEPSLGATTLETGTYPGAIPAFTVEAQGMSPIRFEIDTRPDGLEYYPANPPN